MLLYLVDVEAFDCARKVNVGIGGSVGMNWHSMCMCQVFVYAHKLDQLFCSQTTVCDESILLLCFGIVQGVLSGFVWIF